MWTQFEAENSNARIDWTAAYLVYRRKRGLYQLALYSILFTMTFGGRRRRRRRTCSLLLSVPLAYLHLTAPREGSQGRRRQLCQSHTRSTRRTQYNHHLYNVMPLQLNRAAENKHFARLVTIRLRPWRGSAVTQICQFYWVVLFYCSALYFRRKIRFFFLQPPNVNGKGLVEVLQFVRITNNTIVAGLLCCIKPLQVSHTVFIQMNSVKCS